MEWLCITNSNTVVIDNIFFKSYIIDKYGITPVLAEYGGNHTKKIDISFEMSQKFPFLNFDYSLSVSRAQKDMNIHLLIEVFKKLKKKKIVIISNWYISEYGQKLYKKNVNKYDNIILLNAIYEPEELDTIRSNTNLYIHTHSLCGTAPSLVEAMSLNIPVISFDVPANRHTTENKTLYFKDVKTLYQILNNLNKKKLLDIKNKMFEISRKRYIWERIWGKEFEFEFE